MHLVSRHWKPIGGFNASAATPRSARKALEEAERMRADLQRQS
jgi:hypothetical protein